MANRFTWRKQYDLAEEERAGNNAATVNDEPSLTQQQFTADTDLNEIMRRYGVTDRAIQPAAYPNGVPVVDLSEYAGLELRDLMDQIRTAQEAFANLPAEIRRRFDNNPEELWTYVANPANQEEAVSLGLLTKDAPAFTAAPPVAPTSAPASTAPSTSPTS